MNHRVINVDLLYYAASRLYNDVVVGGNEFSADFILGKLERGIENLKNNWKGADASYRIQELIKVHNAMVAVRNALASLAVDSSKVAVNYREIQIANGAKLDSLSVLSYEPKTNLDDYLDSTPGLDINPSAKIGKGNVDTANNSIDQFISEIRREYDEIMQNWVSGTGRDAAEGAFVSFTSNVNQYKQTLSDVSLNLANALANYETMN